MSSFSISTFEHSIAAGVSKVKAGFDAVAKFVAKNGGTISHDLEVVDGVAAFIPGLGPVADVLTRAGETALGLVGKAISDAQHVASNNPDGTVTFSLTMAKTLYDDFATLLPTLKAAAKGASATAAPATIATPVATPAPATPLPGATN